MSDMEYRRKLMATRDADAKHEAHMQFLALKLCVSRSEIRKKLARTDPEKLAAWNAEFFGDRQ